MAKRKIKRGITVTEHDNNANIPGYETLSEREQKYYRMMKPQSGVLMLTSKPGIGKSAITRAIARKMGMKYFDVRLSMVDETDVGLFPKLGTREFNGKTEECLRHVVPEWALEACESPSIIHFEELNRAPLAVRNAALQILLEREIGAFFKFNENVLMVSSGNLGEEDGTDVEEFDQALNNRLIHFQHEMNYEEWREQFAEEHVHPTIVGFLKGYTEYYYKFTDSDSDNVKAYATPRSWTFLSDYIFTNYGKMAEKIDGKRNKVTDKNGEVIMERQWPPVASWINDITAIGNSYVGKSALRFIKYCQESLRITIDDIINNYDKVKHDLEQFNRDKKSELLSSMKERTILDLKPAQLENLIKFLVSVTKDERTGYILHVLDNEYSMENEGASSQKAEKFLSDKRFKDLRDTIYEHLNKKPEDGKEEKK